MTNDELLETIPTTTTKQCTQCGEEFVCEDESGWLACPGCRLSWIGPDAPIEEITIDSPR